MLLSVALIVFPLFTDVQFSILRHGSSGTSRKYRLSGDSSATVSSTSNMGGISLGARQVLQSRAIYPTTFILPPRLRGPIAQGEHQRSVALLQAGHAQADWAEQHGTAPLDRVACGLPPLIQAKWPPFVKGIHQAFYKKQIV